MGVCCCCCCCVPASGWRRVRVRVRILLAHRADWSTVYSIYLHHAYCWKAWDTDIQWWWSIRTVELRIWIVACSHSVCFLSLFFVTCWLLYRFIINPAGCRFAWALHIMALFSSKIFYKNRNSRIFVCIWQILSDYRLTKLKKFIS